MSAQDWAGIEVPGMYAVAKVGADPESWQQVTAWYKTLELLNFHEEQLRMARDELAERWPPDRSPAAAAFVTYMDQLLLSLNKAQDDAAANHRALGLLLLSLAHVKQDMAALNAKYEEYEAEQQNRNKNPVNYTEHSGGTTWREELNERARQRMGQADQEVFEASNQMVVATNLDMPREAPADNRLHENGGSGSDTSAGSDSQSTHSLLHAVVPSPDEVDAHLRSQQLTDPSAFDEASTGLAGGTSADIGVSLPPAALGPGNGPATGGTGPLNPPAGWIPPSVGGLRIGPPGGVVGTPRPEGLAPRGPLPGAGVPGGRGTSIPGASGQRRVNPVGGVIGESRPPSGGTSLHRPGRMNGSDGATGGMRGTGALGGVPAGHGRRSQESDRPGDPEAYRIWPVAEGVAPVIESRPEPYHDPGPGVIGIDR